MRVLLLSMIVTMVMGGGLACSSNSLDREQYLALKAERRGKPDSAESHLRRVMELSAEEAPGALTDIARVRAQLSEDLPGSIEVLVELTSTYPDSPEADSAQEAIADAFFGPLGDLGAAEAAYGRCQEVSPDAARRDRCTLRAALCALRRMDPQQTLEHLTSLIQESGEREAIAKAMVLAAHAHELQGDGDAALRWFREVQLRFADSTSAQEGRLGEAGVLETAGRLEQALEIYRGLAPTYFSPDTIAVRIASLEERIARRDGGGRGD